MADPVVTDTSPENLLRLRRVGATYRDLMRLTGLSRAAIEYRLDGAMPRRAEMQIRRCLCCGKEFLSHGPGNRMCGRCRKSAADVSPYAPDIA